MFWSWGRAVTKTETGEAIPGYEHYTALDRDQAVNNFNDLYIHVRILKRTPNPPLVLSCSQHFGQFRSRKSPLALSFSQHVNSSHGV